MSDTILVRLCGGPFDGERDEARCDDAGDPPPRIWVRRCPHCRESHWEDHPGQGGEVYRREGQDGEWHVYVFTDSRLGVQREAERRELVPVGAPADDDNLEWKEC